MNNKKVGVIKCGASIRKYGLIYIGKMIMICLRTFEDDFFVWKKLLCYCSSQGIDHSEINN